MLDLRLDKAIAIATRPFSTFLEHGPNLADSERSSQSLCRPAGAASRFLNLDKPYPNQLFTLIIWGRNRAKFGTPEVDLKGKRVCAEGLIESYRGTPQIEAKEPGQIKVEKE